MPNLAMTGEVTLTGRVLPVGGVREKILAARRAGIKVVLLPRHNEKDLVDIPAEVKADLTLRLVDTLSDVVPYLFDARSSSAKTSAHRPPLEKPAPRLEPRQATQRPQGQPAAVSHDWSSDQGQHSHSQRRSIDDSGCRSYICSGRSRGFCFNAAARSAATGAADPCAVSRTAASASDN